MTKGAVIFNPGYRSGGFLAGGRRIFGRGMKLFSIILWGHKNFKSNSDGVKNYFS